MLQSLTSPRFQGTLQPPAAVANPSTPNMLAQDVAALSNKLGQGRTGLLNGIKTAAPRLVDALGMFVWSNVLFGPGHVFMLPIALADGAVAVNEFRKASGMKPLAHNKATEEFLTKAKASLDKAKFNAAAWEKPFKSLYKLGLATTAAGILIHPLIFVGLAMMALPTLARDIGITVNVFKQLLTQGKSQANVSA